MKKRILSMLMVLCMVFTLLPSTAFAAEGNIPLGTSSVTGSGKAVCENHKEHDDDCGYIKAVAEKVCSHLNEDGTYSCAPVRDSGVASPSIPEKAYACDHDDACGYTKAVKEKPCTHECELCKPAEKPAMLKSTREADDVITGNGYTFVKSTGALTVTNNNGTTAWRTDTAITPDITEQNLNTSVKSVTIERGVESIGQSAFQRCSSLTSITIPDSVTSIGTYAFSKCSDLTSITIPENVTSIGNAAFNQCSKLAAVTFEGESQLETIAADAFNSCSGLTSIAIPDSVTFIGDQAFISCSNLAEVICKRTTPPTLGAGVFSSTDSSLKIKVPDASVDTYKQAANWSTWASKIEGGAPTDTPNGTKITTALNFISDAPADCTAANGGGHTHSNAVDKCFTWADDTLTMNNLTLEAADSEGYAIKLPGSALVETNAGTTNTITSTGGGTSGYGSHGIYGTSMTLTNNGTLTVTGGTSSAHTYGIFDNTTITIGGTGTLNATGGSAGISNSYGIYGASGVTINSGTVNATGGATTSGASIGIRGNSLQFNGGTITAKCDTTSTASKALFKAPTLKGMTATASIDASGSNPVTYNPDNNDSYKWVKLVAAPDAVINIAAIADVTAPVKGAIPVTRITTTAQYTGTVAWSGSPTTFAPDTAYTATITLTPKAGFTLTGVGANFFTVAGASPVTNSANSGVVTAVFPKTAVGTAAAPTFSANLTTTEQVVSKSTSTTLTVAATASDGGTISYQWYSNTANNTSGSSISGATGASYSFTSSATPNNTTYYYCVATNTKDGATATATSAVQPVRTRSTETVKITSPLQFNNSTATQNCTNTEAGAQFHTNHTHANGRPCWAWNRDTATLTLDGVDIEVNGKDQSAISSQVAEMTITLAAGSENTVVNASDGYITLDSSGNLTMNGSGKLTAINNTGEAFMAIGTGGNLKIDGAEVHAEHTGTTAEDEIGTGIDASSITIQNHAVVTASGDIAIISSSDLTIQASTVTATGLKFSGIGATNAVTVEDSTVTVVGGPKNDGISGGTIHLKGSGTVTATAAGGQKPFSKEPILTGMEHDESTGTWDNTTGLACTYQTGSTPTHTHAWASAWSNDNSYHWHNCTGAGSCDITANSGKAGYAAHNYDNSSDTSCNTCGYVRTIDNGGGGGGSSSGGSGNTNSNITVTPPAQDKPNTPTQGEIKLDGKVEGEGATISITDKNITDAFDKALADAKKKGNESNGITLVLSVDTGSKTVNTVTVNLPKTAQETIISKKIVNTVVVVDQPDIVIGMDLATVTEINKQANADVNITATRMGSGALTGNAKTAVGNRPVFDLKVSTTSGKTVQSFGAGSVSVTIPYTLAANEKAGNVQAVYLDGTGKVQWLTSSVYDSVNKLLRFSTNHFSTYGVGYKADAPALTDIAAHWAKDDIQFVVNRGLLAGTSATTFSPDTAMTRGMFVTALGRLANADVSGYKQSSFPDVAANSYYMGYIEWASKNGIVSGGTDGKFSPDASITREQMAVIMSNYAKTIGYTTPKVHAENTFADSAKISAYAKGAVKQMQMAGVLAGKSGNNFDPQGTATRAEVSAVLRRFVELAISSDTMQGWTMNDSGQWMYYQDGKPVTGKKDIDGASYTFDQNGVTADVPKNQKYGTYTVQKNESFGLIAQKLGCSVSELERLNNKTRFEVIHPGDLLIVPEK